MEESASIQLFLSKGYLLSRNCLREVVAMLDQAKPFQLVHEVDQMEHEHRKRRQYVLEETAALTKLSFELERLRNELRERPRDDAALLVALAAAWPRPRDP